MNVIKNYLSILSILVVFFVSGCFGHSDHPKQEEEPESNAEWLTARVVQYEYDDSSKNEVKIFLQLLIKNNQQDTIYIPNKGGINLLYSTRSFFYTCFRAKDTIMMTQGGAGENKVFPENTSYFNMVLTLKSSEYGKVDSLNYKDLVNKVKIQYAYNPIDSAFYRGKTMNHLVFRNRQPTMELLPVNTDPAKAGCGCAGDGK